MKSARFEVLSPDEVERIHGASMEILSTVGVQVEWKTARDLFAQAGAEVEDGSHQVRISEELVRWAADQAPERFTLYGPGEPGDAFRLEIGDDNVCFAGLGTPIACCSIIPPTCTSTRRRTWTTGKRLASAS